MFHSRLAVVRMASVAAIASCLALAACSTASTGDPLASLSAKQVAAKVVAGAKAAASLTLDGTVTDSGMTETVHMAIKPGKGCTGTMGLGSRGSFKLTMVGGTVYLNPDKKFWEAEGGASASQVINLVKGRYLKVPSTDKAVGSLAGICDIGQIFSTNGKQDPFTKGKVTTLNGVRVLALKDTTDGSVTYVTDTSDPQMVEATPSAGATTNAGKITITYDAPVTLTAPPASQVIDGAQFGF